MITKINSRFLPTGFLYTLLSDTLDAYLKREDLTNSPLVEWLRKSVKEGRKWYGCRDEATIQRRQLNVIKLYHDIKEKGYDGSVIVFHFDDEGHIKVRDGYHRLCIMKYLGIVADVNIQLFDFWIPRFHRKGDFPLVKTLLELNNGRRNLYQPVDDDRVKDFTVFRRDSAKRLNYILQHATGKTVLDIGCCEGYFSIELAKRGYTVTALDGNSKRIAIARYLTTIKGLIGKVTCHHTTWETFLNRDVHFDNILFLSTFHHKILRLGLDEAFKVLSIFKGKSHRIFFETPLSTEQIGWLSAEQKQKMSYSFTESKLTEIAEKQMGYTVKEVWREGLRPIFLLAAIQ